MPLREPVSLPLSSILNARDQLFTTSVVRQTILEFQF